jgi:hypothetical protein
VVRFVLSTAFACSVMLFGLAAHADAQGSQGYIIKSARDFGCSGNGGADDSACLTAIANSSVSVWFPAGTYNFYSPLNIQYPIVLYGQGNNVSQLVYKGSGDTPAITWNPRSNLNYGMGMRDIGLSGNAPIGIFIGGNQTAAGFECRGCKISGFNESGVTYGSNAWNILFDHSEFVNTPVTFPNGISNSGEQMVYRNTTFASTDGNFHSNCVVISSNTQTIFDGDSFDGCQLVITNSGALVTILNTHFEAPGMDLSNYFLSLSAGTVELDNVHMAVENFTGISSLVNMTGGMLNLMNGVLSVDGNPIDYFLAANAGKVNIVNPPYLGGVSNLVKKSGNVKVTQVGDLTGIPTLTTSAPQVFNGPITSPVLSSSGAFTVTSKVEPLTLFPSYGSANNYRFGLGLNCTFDTSLGKWVAYGDGANNGGACLTTTAVGNLEIYPLATSGGSTRNWSPSELSSNLTAVFSATAETFNRPVLMAGSAPTVAPGSALGSNPAVSLAVGSTTNKGQLVVTTGSAPASNGMVATITFPQSLPNPLFCSIDAGNSATANLALNAAPYISSDPSNKNFAIHGNMTPLAANTSYRWQYTCF